MQCVCERKPRNLVPGVSVTIEVTNQGAPAGQGALLVWVIPLQKKQRASESKNLI